MELHNEFNVALPPDQTWSLLTDLQKVAPCLPGASITSVEGEDFHGRAKIKVGPITAELLKHLGPPYRATDVVGLSGLQNAFEKRLAGTPTGEIDIVSTAGQRVRAVKRFPGTPGKDVTVTIDPHVQQAAGLVWPHPQPLGLLHRQGDVADADDRVPVSGRCRVNF